MLQTGLNSRLRSCKIQKHNVLAPSSVALPVQLPATLFHSRTLAGISKNAFDTQRSRACCAASATEQAGGSIPSPSEAEVEGGGPSMTDTFVTGEYQVPDAPTFPSLGVDQLFMVSSGQACASMWRQGVNVTDSIRVCRGSGTYRNTCTRVQTYYKCLALRVESGRSVSYYVQACKPCSSHSPEN